jgi:hypothetical protein
MLEIRVGIIVVNTHPLVVEPLRYFFYFYFSNKIPLIALGCKLTSSYFEVFLAISPVFILMLQFNLTFGLAPKRRLK